MESRLKLNEQEYNNFKRNRDYKHIKELDVTGIKISSLDGNVFDYFVNLTSLNLSNNQISQIEKEHFKQIGESLELLNLSNNQISSLDDIYFNSFKKLLKLDLSNNQVKEIKKEDFSKIGKTLKILNLSNNKISSFRDHIFDSFVNLTHLSLNNNQISQIKQMHFSQIAENLELLNLSSNKISSLDLNVLSLFKKLKDLNLSNNQISHIKKENFKQIAKTLNYLNLSNNKISSLDLNIFYSFVRLWRLDLSNNQISKIKKEPSSKIAKALFQLDLSNNKIESLHDDIFDSFVNLKTLYLSNNQISQIKKEHFKQIGKTLFHLYLSNNRISSLHVDVFDSFEKLTWLDLSNNQISQVENKHFNKIAKTLNRLYLSNNKIESLDIFDSSVVGEHLTWLDLASNNLFLENLSFLTNVSNLKNLLLSNNRLAFFDVFNIKKLQGLEYLDFSSNGVTELKASCTGTSNVKELYLNFNQIQNIDSKYFRKNFPKLKRLELVGNNLNNDFDFKCIGSKPLTLCLGQNNFEPTSYVPKGISLVETFKANSLGYIKELNLQNDHRNFIRLSDLKWENVKMFSVITGSNGIGKTSILQFTKSCLEYIYNSSFDSGSSIDWETFPLKSKSSIFGSGQNVYPLLLKHINAPESIFCVDENELVKVFTQNVDSHLVKFYYWHIENSRSIDLFKKGSSILSFRSLELCLSFLKSDILNGKLTQLFIENKFKYDIKWNDERDEFIFVEISNHSNKTYLNNLSPGEQLILLFLFWKYIYSHYKVNGKTVLLFDEPDAHLNPGAVKQFLDVIKYLVELGIQVIMTTHNPITVSLVLNEHLFKLENNNQNKRIEMNKVTSKYDVFNLLTDNLAFVSEPIRLVFTEGNGLDNLFYNHIKQVYNDVCGREEIVSFIFRSMGSKHFKQFFSKKLIKQESKEIAQALNATLYGIVDGDYFVRKSFEHFNLISNQFPCFFVKNSKNKISKCQKEELDNFNEHLIRLERYAIENFIHDPLNLFVCLKEIKDATYLNEVNTFLGFDSTLTNYQCDSVDKFLRRSELTFDEKQGILNDILKSVSNSIIDYIVSILNYSGKEKDFDLKKILTTSLANSDSSGFLDTFGFETKETIVKEILVKSKQMLSFPIKLIHSDNGNLVKFELKYNPILLFIKGKTLSKIMNTKIKFDDPRKHMSRIALNLFFFLKEIIESDAKLAEINNILGFTNSSLLQYQENNIDSFLSLSDLTIKEKEKILNEIIKTLSDATVDFIKRNQFVSLNAPLSETFNKYKNIHNFSSIEDMLENSKLIQPFKETIDFKINGNLAKFEIEYNPVLLDVEKKVFEEIFRDQKIYLDPMNQDKIKLELILKKENGFVFTEDLFNIIEFLSKKTLRKSDKRRIGSGP